MMTTYHKLKIDCYLNTKMLNKIIFITIGHKAYLVTNYYKKSKLYKNKKKL